MFSFWKIKVLHKSADKDVSELTREEENIISMKEKFIIGIHLRTHT